jgi:nucleoside-diphosphate-sugar epimerase
VIGGAGRTGRHIVDRLRRDGIAGKVLSRNPDRVPDGVEVVAGDITRSDSVAEAMRGVDWVVLVVESAMNDDGSPNSPTAVHDHGTANVIAAAADDVHVVMVSQIYITRPEAFPAAADVIAARGRGEQALRIPRREGRRSSSTASPASRPPIGRRCSPGCGSGRSGYS